VFLCESGGPWLVDDGVRSMPKSAEDWMAFDVVLGRMAREEGVGVRVIPREMLDQGQRMRFVKEVQWLCGVSVTPAEASTVEASKLSMQLQSPSRSQVG
jgi:hypothetical protein